MQPPVLVESATPMNMVIEETEVDAYEENVRDYEEATQSRSISEESTFTGRSEGEESSSQPETPLVEKTSCKL